MFLAPQGIRHPPGPPLPSAGQRSKKSRSTLILPSHFLPAKMVRRAGSRWLRLWGFIPPIPAPSSDTSLHGLSPTRCPHAPNHHGFPQHPPAVSRKVPEPPSPASTPQRSPATDPQAATEAAEPEQAAGATPVGEHPSPGGRRGACTPGGAWLGGLFSQRNLFLLSLIQPFCSSPRCLFARHGHFPDSSPGLQSLVVSFGFSLSILSPSSSPRTRCVPASCHCMSPGRARSQAGTCRQQRPGPFCFRNRASTAGAELCWDRGAP